MLETEWLARGIVDRIVKLEDTAAGVVPGEGAGVLVLERHADAATRGVEPVALVGNLALADEPIRYDGAEPLEATALSEALHGILDHLEAGPGAIGDVLVDLNGERGRFQEWALAEGRCLHRLADGWRLHAPALSLGDLGAASGVVTVGIAALMLQRRRARGDAALVCSMSANGERACALVGAPRTKVQ